jgi:hypothetical protein
VRWSNSHADRVLAGTLGGPRTRPAALRSLPTQGAAITVFAASFDPSGAGGFCFGSAARGGAPAAAEAALRELAQAELGLAMARARAAPTDTHVLQLALLGPGDLPRDTGGGGAGPEEGPQDFASLAASLPAGMTPTVADLTPTPPFHVCRASCPGLLPGKLSRTTVHTLTTLTSPVEVALF